MKPSVFFLQIIKKCILPEMIVKQMSPKETIGSLHLLKW